MLALASAAEVIHGAPCRFSDPARFSLSHGGKDGHPFPVPLRVYDETLGVLRQAVDRAKLGEDDRLAAVRRLDEEARRLEGAARGPTLEAFLDGEQRASRAYGGRSVLEGTSPRRAREPEPKLGGGERAAVAGAAVPGAAGRAEPAAAGRVPTQLSLLRR